MVGVDELVLHGVQRMEDQIGGDSTMEDGGGKCCWIGDDCGLTKALATRPSNLLGPGFA